MLPLALGLANLGIDEHTGQTFVIIEDEDAPLDTNLRSGQTQARSVVHRGEHVVDQAGDATVDVVDLARTLCEDRVTDDADLVRSHGRQG